MDFNGKWSDMSNKQQRAAKEKYGSRESWQGEKKRMAGDAIYHAQPHENETKPAPVAKQVEDINNYDNTSYGAGAGKGANRVSRKDLQELERQGFSHQEIIDYSEKQVKDGAMQGQKAQNLLNDYKAGLTKQEPAPTPEPTPEPTQPTPEPTQPAPTPTQPTPELTQPTPAPTQPTPELTQPTPELTQPTPEPTQPAPTPTQPTPEPTPEPTQPADPSPAPAPTVERKVPDVIKDLTDWSDNRGIGWSNGSVQNTKHSDAVMERGTSIDKPGDAQSFVNKYINMNTNLAAKSRANRPDIAGNAINNINKYGTDLTALDTSLRQRGQVSRDRALISSSNLFGDMHAMTPPDWRSGLGKQPPVERPDLGDIYDEGKNDIDDLF